MRFMHLKWRFRLAVIFWAASFILFLLYLTLSRFNIFIPAIFVFSLPIKLTQFIFGWELITAWKAYTAGLVFAPVYYAVLGYFIGLIIEKAGKKD